MPGPIRKNPKPTPMPPKFGGNIPSPDPNGYSSSAESRRPASAGGDRDAMLRSYMAAMQDAVPQEPTFSDIPNMTPEELAPYNKPADKPGDLFNQPGDRSIIQMLMERLMGGGR